MPSRPAYLSAPATSFTRSISGRLGKGLMLCGIGMLLAGCAAQMSYRDGKDLVAQGKVDEGLSKFQQATLQDPDNAQYRLAYLQTRERTVSDYVEQANRLAAAGNAADAEKFYRHALSISPDSERALAGLRALDTHKRHARLLEEARAAWEKKDTADAQMKLDAILAENPHHAGALALEHAIHEKNATPPIEAALSAAYKKPISIEFKDVALKQLFEVISRTSGLNFLFDKDVKTDRKTSIFLKNSTIESAVNFTLLTNQLEQRVLDKNTILIYPDTAAKQKDYQEMVVKSFFLSNADAKEVAKTLKTILKSRDMVVNEKLNMLIVRDTPDAIKLAEKLVAIEDVPEPEVMLEVEVLEVSRSKLQDLGIQWPDSLSLTPLPPGSLSTSSTSSGSLSLRDLRHQNSSSIAVGISPITINANNQDSDANILANPRIRVRNHEKAKILIGERVPNITTTATSTGFVSESVNYIDVGLTLNVEPTIHLDDDVSIKISLEVSNIVSQIKTPSGSVAYQIGTRTANTVLSLKDGENQVLAGLINDEDRRSGNKIPGIGEIPILGRLFGTSSNNRQKTEIVLSITPHLIRNIHRPDAGLSEFRSGTDSKLRSQSDLTPAGIAPRSPAIVPPRGNPMPSSRAAPNAMDNPAPSTLNNSSPAVVNSNETAANPVAPAGAQLTWQGPAQVKTGDTFTLQVAMQSTQPITSLPMTIGYDNHVLQVVSVTEGDFLKQDGTQTSFTSRVDPNGQIRLADTRTGDSGAATPGTVASIKFKTLTTVDATRVQVLTAMPVGLAGHAVAAALPAPYITRIQP